MPHLQTLRPGHDRSRSLGFLAVAWIEHFVRHGPGSLLGERMTLDQDFFDAVLDMYALDKNGRRLYHTVVLSRPKGTAKSEIAGALSILEALGPCRFAGWAKGGETFEFLDFTYTYSAGEPMGRVITAPIISALAVAAGQADNTFRNVLATLDDSDSPLVGLPGVEAGRTRILIPGHGSIAPATSGSASKDGRINTFSVSDEVHLFILDELREMFYTIDRGKRKRPLDEPWMLCTTTMHRDGEDSIGERLYKVAMSIKEGTVKNPGVLYDHREGSAITDLSDEVALKASLEEAYGFRTWIDYAGYVQEAVNPLTSTEAFRRYFLNQQAASATAFVTSQELAAIQQIDGEPIAPLRKGDIITMGFDYAPGNRSDANRRRRVLRIPDATALIACRLSDMSLHPLGIWEATEAAAMQGWNPPIQEIEQTVHDSFRDYQVVGMFADPTGIEGYLDKWTARYLRRLKAKASTDRPMYRYMSGRSATRSGKDVEALYEAVVTEQVHMVQDSRLTRHFLNARRAVGRYGLALFKKTPDSPDKIDAAVSSVLAYAAAVQALNKGVGGTGKPKTAPRRLY